MGQMDPGLRREDEKRRIALHRLLHQALVSSMQYERGNFEGEVHLERRRSEELPAVTLQHVRQLALVHRCEFAAGPLLLFYQPACPGRSVKKQHAPGFGAGALPGMRHARAV